MTDHIDNGTYRNYHALACKILERAIRDAFTTQAGPRYRLNALTFLQAPATVEFYRLADLDVEKLMNRAERMAE